MGRTPLGIPKNNYADRLHTSWGFKTPHDVTIAALEKYVGQKGHQRVERPLVPGVLKSDGVSAYSTVDFSWILDCKDLHDQPDVGYG